MSVCHYSQAKNSLVFKQFVLFLKSAESMKRILCLTSCPGDRKTTNNVAIKTITCANFFSLVYMLVLPVLKCLAPLLLLKFPFHSVGRGWISHGT